MALDPHGTHPQRAPKKDELLRHVEYVERLARTLVRNEDEARDVAQDVWLSTLRNPPRNAVNLRGWFRTLVRRAAWRRSGGFETVPLDLEDVLAERETRTTTRRAQVLEDIANGLDRLPERYRTTLRSRFVDGMSPQRIAQERACSVHTVNTQIRRGLEKLRERLDRRYGDRRSWVLVLLGRPAADVGWDPLRPPLRQLVSGQSVMFAAVAVAAVLLVVLGVRLGEKPVEPLEPLSSLDPSLVTEEEEVALQGAGPDNRTDEDAVPRAGLASGAVRLLVRVADRDGRPVEGASVWRFLEGHPFEELGTSDRNGHVVAELRLDEREATLFLGNREVWSLGAFAEGRVGSDTFYIEEGADALTLTVGGRGVSLTGVVRDERGAAVAGARVLTARSDRFPHQVTRHTWRRGSAYRVVTDEQGHFALSGLAPGNHTLRIQAPGFMHETLRLRELVDTHVVNIALEHGAVVYGTVTYRGAPLAGARVWSRAWNASLGRRTVTDEEGRFRLEGLAPRTHELWVQSGADELVGSRQVFEVAAGEAYPWNPDCGPLLGNYARLLSEDGEPLEGWTVKFESTSGPKRTRWERTDAEGRVRLVPAIADAVASVYGPVTGGFPVETGRELHAASGPGSESQITVRTRELCTLEGTIRRAPAQPFSFAEVRLRKEEVAGTRVAVDEMTGTFRVERLPAGTYEVMVWKDCQVISLGRHSVLPGSVTELPPMIAEVPGHLSVAWPDASARFALTKLFPERDVEIRTASVPDAEYVLQPGRYRVEALRAGDVVDRRIVQVGSGESLTYTGPSEAEEDGN